MLTTIADDRVLDAAYTWLCERRKGWPSDADVWSLRFFWPTEKLRLREELLTGRYRFEPLSRVTKRDGEVLHLWSARDALVLKALAIVLGNHLPVSRRCVHVKGHGGAKAAVRAVRDHLPTHNFVLRTDVKSYYESIEHDLLLEMLAAHIKDRGVLNLLWQVMRRTVTWGGLYRDCKRGISRGCPLSPLLGAVFLTALDSAMEGLGLFYVRFMDDVLVLAPTRWKLKRAVKCLNEIFDALALEKHPDKTFIGRIEKGFDFLGYRFGRDGLTAAKDTLKRFVERATRLYEQERGKPEGFPLLGLYVRRWLRWHAGGLTSRARAGGTSHLPVGKPPRSEWAMCMELRGT
jgi:RNA-directed DNA polymerase